MNGEEKGRVNGYAAKWCEIAASTKFRLERVDENVCDAYATEETPVVESGTPVEIKGAMVWIGNGVGARMRGRFTIGKTHEQLLDEGGEYALVVYEEVGDPEGQGCIIVRRCSLIPATTVDALLSDEAKAEYRKLSWGNVFQSLDYPD